ncbi:MAG: tyrosine recombinase XerC [Oscillospiraceae bacterium]|nr:tyrosine recombinase XerC [Oscillospiraceae bacterium]
MDQNRDNRENMETLPPSARQYLMYLSTIKGCSKLTVKEYIFDLRVFFRFLKQRKQKTDQPFDEIEVAELDLDFVGSISKEEIFEFLFFMSEQKGNINNSRARKLSAVKGFFKYLTTQAGKLEANPAENIESPTIRQALPKYLSLEESVNLLNAIQDDEKNQNRVRDYAILTLFLNCGMRLSELVGIDLDDIALDYSTIRVLGKRKKERFVYLNDPCKKALSDYLEIRKKQESIKDERALFVSRNRRRVSNSTVQKMVELSFFKAGLSDKNYSTHKLRHTAATLMYQNGVDTRVLQEILGHEHLNTTQIYTHVASPQLRDAADKNPLAKIRQINKTNMTEDNKNDE